MRMQVNYDVLWSEEAKARRPAALKSIINKFAHHQDVIGMHGGLPPSSAFPITGITLQLSDGSTVQLTDLKTITMAQQYNLNFMGYMPLVQWARHTTMEQQQPASPVEVVVTCGSTQALDVVLAVLANPGDLLLVEEFTYAHGLESVMEPRRLGLLPIAMDAEGLCPKALRSTLVQRADAGLKLPRLLYIIPTGQNPTGTSMSTARMAEVYAVAQEFDLIIIEDDAYYWLQYGDESRLSADTTSADMPGLNLPTRFLALDTDGRVVRLDTFAKLLGPGFRLGWISAPAPLAHKIALTIDGTCVGPSSFSQVIISSLLDQWGRTGFEAFLRNVQAQYARKAAAAIAAARHHLDGHAVFVPPCAGMFLWVNVTGLEDASAVVDAAEAEGVSAVPGRAFWATSSKQAIGGVVGKACPFLRISFVTLPIEHIDEGMQRLRSAIDSASKAALVGACQPVQSPKCTVGV